MSRASNFLAFNGRHNLDTRMARMLIVMGLVIAVLVLGSSWQNRESAKQEAMACDPEKGSRRVFPPSGPIALSSEEKELAELIAPVVMPKAAGSGVTHVVNRGSIAIVAVFHDEDGAPRARAFVRAGDSASVELPVGSYDAMATSGTDWSGEAFALGCAKTYKVRGVIAVEKEKASLAELSDKSGFVRFNRKEAQQALDALLENNKESGSALPRPDRQSEPDRGPVGPKP